MNTRMTVQALLDAVQQGDLGLARSLLAAGFQYRGLIPQPMNAKTWLALCSSLKAAFPDLDYGFHIVDVHGDVVVLTAQLSGTHTGDLDLTGGMDLGVIPATYKSFSAGLQRSQAAVERGRVSAWADRPADDAGLMAILRQLDVYIADAIVPRGM